MRSAVVLLMVLLLAGLLHAGTVSIDIFHANTLGIDNDGRAIYQSGALISYSHSVQLRQTFDGLLGIMVIDSASSSEFYGKDDLNLIIRGGVGTSYDTSPEGVFGMRFSATAGLVLMNFSDFGWFLNISPLFYVRIGSICIGAGGGVDLMRFVNIDLTGSWTVRFELGYGF